MQKEIITMVHGKIFEHTIKSNYLFRRVFMYPDNDNNQRSIWNCVDYYPVRHIKRENVRFTDDVIYDKLSKFRAHENELIIIDRKHNRKFDNGLLESN